MVGMQQQPVPTGGSAYPEAGRLDPGTKMLPCSFFSCLQRPGKPARLGQVVE